MTVNTTWVSPVSATIDLAAGALVGEANWDALASDLYRLGGADGNTKTGHYGLGVSPSAWNSQRNALQLGGGAALAGSVGVAGVLLTDNSFLNAGGQYVALTTAAGVRVISDGNGALRIGTAPSVAAAAVQTFTDRFTFDATTLALGTTLALASTVPTLTMSATGAGSAVRVKQATAATVSTTATTLYTITGYSGGLSLVRGSDASNVFGDLVFWGPVGGATAVSSKTLLGAPAARTYTVVGSDLRLALASGTYSVDTFTLELGN